MLHIRIGLTFKTNVDYLSGIILSDPLSRQVAERGCRMWLSKALAQRLDDHARRVVTARYRYGIGLLFSQDLTNDDNF